MTRKQLVSVGTGAALMVAGLVPAVLGVVEIVISGVALLRARL